MADEKKRIEVEFDASIKNNTKSGANEIEQEIDRMENSIKKYAEALNVLKGRLSSIQKFSRHVFKDMKNVSEEDLGTLIDFIDDLGEEINRVHSKASLDKSLLGTSKDKTINDIEDLIKAYERLNSTIGENENIARSVGGVKATVPGVGTEASLKKYKDLSKKSWDTVGKYAMSISDTSWNMFTKTGKTSLNVIGGMFKTLGKSAVKVWDLFGSRGKSTTSMLANQLKSFAGLFSIYRLINTGKDAVDLTSDMIEIRNVVESVFGDATQSIEEFSKESIKNFGLTELQAQKMIGVFGGMLEASNIVGVAQSTMSKNLTALAGDLSSFYNIPIDDVFTKLKSGLAGETEPLRAFGVNMTVANLEAYALSKGIDASWESMNQATQQTLRYNYILEHLAIAQGDFAKTSMTWANQVRLLSSNFQQLLSILGGAAIQVLYPVVKILNQIISLSIQASSRLANMLGFDYKSLESQFGVGSDMSDIGELDTSMEVDTSGIDDYTDSTNKAADATKNFSDSAEKAGDNLQSFDKINNITTDSMKNYDDVADSTKGLEDALSNLGGSSLIEPLSYFENVKAPGDYVNKWLDEWIDLLENKQWYEAGNKLAKLVSKGLQNVYDVLSDEETLDKAEELGEGLGEFFNGVVDETDMFLNAGKTLGAGVNLFTKFYNSLFDTADFKQFGRSFMIGIKGLVNEVDGEEVGKALTQTFRAAIDFVAGAIEDKSIWEDTGNFIGDVVNGAIENVDLSTAIPTLVGLAGRLFQTQGVAFEKIRWEELSSEITEGINTSIEEIDPKEFGTTLGNMVLDLLKVLNGVLDADWDEAGEKFGESVNSLVDTGATKETAKTATKFIGKLVDLLSSAAETIDWGRLIRSIFNGFSEGIEDFSPGTQTLTKMIVAFLGLSGGIGAVGKVTGKIVSLATGINELASAIELLFGVSKKKPTGTVADAIGDVASATGTGAGSVAKKTGRFAKFKSGLATFGKGTGIIGAYAAYLTAVIKAWSVGEKVESETRDNIKAINDGLDGVSEKSKDISKSLKELDKDTFNFDYTSVNDALDNVLKIKNEFESMGSNVQNFIARGGKSGGFLLGSLTSQTTLKTLKKEAQDIADILKSIGDEENYSKIKDALDFGSKQDIASTLNDIRTQYSEYLGGISSLTADEIYKINLQVSDAVVEFKNGAEEIVSLAGDSIIGISRDTKSGIDYLITASGNAFDTSTQQFTEVTDEMKNSAVSAINGVTGVFNSDGSVSEAALNLAYNAGVATISGFGEMKINASNAVTETANEIINSSSELKNAVGYAIDDATTGNLQNAENKGKEIGDNLRNSIENSFIRNPLNIYANLKVDTSDLRQYTVGSGKPITQRSRITGTATGYDYSGGGISTFSALSAVASRIAPNLEGVETYDLDTSKFSGMLAKSSGSFKASSPNVLQVSPRNLETAIQLKTSSEIDSRTIEKLNSLISSMRDMRRYSQDGDQVFYITIGNKQIDDYIVEVERRNNFRLGR